LDSSERRSSQLFSSSFFVSWQVFPGFIFSWIFCALAQTVTG
jgi:hypothetical protein